MTDKIATKYWDKEWKRRDKGRYTSCNAGKFEFVNKQLSSRSAHIAPLRTLEVGCGSCLHIKTLGFDHPEWKENYIGIDESPQAIEIANRWGINAEVANIYDFNPETSISPLLRKFELFLFLDVLEHIEHHDIVAEQIKKLSADKFCIIGNVPLYLSHVEDDGYEREMNVNVIANFIRMVGINKFAHIVYGINGWPYMWFEAQ